MKKTLFFCLGSALIAQNTFSISNKDLQNADQDKDKKNWPNFTGHSFDGSKSKLDLSGKILTGIDLSKCILTNIIFKGTTLINSSLQGATVLNCDMTGAILTGANLSGAMLVGATLPKADLSGANLSGAVLTGANLAGATLSGCNLSKNQLSNIHVADGEKVDVATRSAIGLLDDYKNFLTANKSIAAQTLKSIIGCLKLDLSNQNLNNKDLSGIDFTGSDFTGTNLSGSNLSGCTFTNVNFANANFSNANVTTTTFKDCNLAGANFLGCRLSKDKLINIQIGQLLDTDQLAATSGRQIIYNAVKIDIANTTDGDLLNNYQNLIGQLNDANFLSDTYGDDCDKGNYKICVETLKKILGCLKIDLSGVNLSASYSGCVF